MEIVPGIHRVDGLSGVNAYIYLPEGGPVVVVDTGLGGNSERIVRQVEALGRRREDVQLILLTHADVDHCGSAAALKRLTGAQIAIHAADAPGLVGDGRYVRARGLSGLLFRAISGLFRFETVAPDLVLSGGEAVEGLEVVPCPGHTAGSVCYLKPGSAAFVGDALGTDRQGKPQLPPKARCLDKRQARESITKIAGLDFDALLPGHGEPISRGARQAVGALGVDLSKNQ